MQVGGKITGVRVMLCLQGMEICAEYSASSAESQPTLSLFLPVQNHQVSLPPPPPPPPLSLSLSLSLTLSCSRWGRLRATMMPWPGLVEPFTECFGLGLLGALCLYFLITLHPLLFLLVHTSIWFTFDLMLLKLIEVGMLLSINI